MPITARELTLNIIMEVHQNKSYVNFLLPEKLEKSQLSKLDRALTTELVCGVLRMEGTIDWILSQFSSRKIDKILPEVLDILRIGIYQLIYLNKIPPHAVIDESVKLAKKNFHQGVANFVNGILRTINREKNKIVYPRKEDNLIDYISVKYSHPKWLVQKWISELGPEETEDLCKANNVRPKLKLRTNLIKITPDKLANLLKKRGIITTSGSFLDECLMVVEGFNLASLREFKEGFFFIQGESSMLVSRIVNPKAGDTILDICAAPGGKTTHLAEIMKNQGQIIAVDLHRNRLKLLEDSCKRMGIKIAVPVQADATKLGETINKPVDKVLLDAPCSGLGTLAKRPDARWQKSLRQIKELAVLQQKLLKSASSFVKCGGSLVYSVCTISKEETIDTINFFLHEHPEFKLEDINSQLPLSLKSKNKWLQLLPNEHQTDGMFIAGLIRTE